VARVRSGKPTERREIMCGCCGGLDWVREEELERQRQDRQNRRRERAEEAEVQVNQEGPNRGQEP
jgi:hypothetical protein